VPLVSARSGTDHAGPVIWSDLLTSHSLIDIFVLLIVVLTLASIGIIVIIIVTIFYGCTICGSVTREWNNLYVEAPAPSGIIIVVRLPHQLRSLEREMPCNATKL